MSTNKPYLSGFFNRKSETKKEKKPNNKAPADPEKLVEIQSFVSLAMLIYFHFYFNFMWWLITLVVFMYKLFTFPLQVYEIIVFVIIFIAFTIIEPGRLYVAQTGNYKEHFERMCGFLVLSLINGGQFVYYIAFQPHRMKIDIIVGSMEAVFYLGEILCTLFALRHFVRVSSFKSHGHFDSSGVMYIDTEENNEIQAFETLDEEDSPTRPRTAPIFGSK